ncbi:hypothetical protein Golomagni_04851 [Golovinomyces magnicellulatus]|nr:hypothetical protein Golomagni_04851 [Golovinomyces magnicellulatus]
MKAYTEDQKLGGTPSESFDSKRHSACSVACSTISDDSVTSLINRLRLNVATWKAQQASPSGHSPQFTHENANIF